MMGVKRTDENLVMLYALYLAGLGLGNIMDGKYFSFMGGSLPASALAYPVTFFVTCVICELWSREDAYRLVFMALVFKFFGVILLGLAQVLKIFPDYGARHDLWGILGTSFWELAGSFVLGRSVRFWAGSIVTFTIAQYTGIWVYSAMREWHIKWYGSPWGLHWARYLAGAFMGELMENLLFMSLVFAPDFGAMWPDVLRQLHARNLLTLFWLPVFCIITWRKRRK